MTDSAPASTPAPAPAPGRWRGRLVYLVTILVTAGLTVGLLALLQNIRERKREGEVPKVDQPHGGVALQNIRERKREGEQFYFKVVDLDENTVDPAEWGKNFPRQYDGYVRTADNGADQYGGNDALPPSKLALEPRLVPFFKGYLFSVDYRERRGHAFMLNDQEKTKRNEKTVEGLSKQPGACIHCHASVLPLYRYLGGGDDRDSVMKGFGEARKMPYWDAHDLTDKAGRRLVDHPVSCLDCHDPKSVHLRVTRPAFLEGIRALAASDAEVPHLKSVQEWRAKKKRDPNTPAYDPNAMATRQEMRSFVCGQCHVEYYFRKDDKRLVYPWANGLHADQIEAYYEKAPKSDGTTGRFTDWTHAISGAPMLKAQHPELEMWSAGIHARSNVACADCHMPYQREGAVKISDHQVRSPLQMIDRACLTCHRWPDEEMRARVADIQRPFRSDVKGSLADRALGAVIELAEALQKAPKDADEKKLAAVRDLHRSAQWRVDFVLSDNSHGFHAPREGARLLGEAIDLARQGQLEALRAGWK
jgi:nitrite reductase (cytochrome c-552)